MIEKYRIVFANNVFDLSEKVNDLLGRGWITQGGIGVSGNVLMQALILLND